MHRHVYIYTHTYLRTSYPYLASHITSVKGFINKIHLSPITNRVDGQSESQQYKNIETIRQFWEKRDGNLILLGYVLKDSMQVCIMFQSPISSIQNPP